MKISISDRVIEKLHQRRELVRDRLAQEYKGVKPFRMEPVSNADLLYDYNTNGFEIFRELYETQGEEIALDYKNQMETLKVKLGGRNA